MSLLDKLDKFKKSQGGKIIPEPERKIEKFTSRAEAIDLIPRVQKPKKSKIAPEETLEVDNFIQSPSNITFMKISEDLFGKSIREPIPIMIDVFLDRLKAMKETLKKKGNTYYYKIQK